MTHTIEHGELVLDLRALAVRVGYRRIALTRIEFGLLECLAKHPGWVFSKEQLLELVWGYEFGDARTVSVHMANLRRKLGESPGGSRYIHTVKGAGYKLEVPPARTERVCIPPSPSIPLVGREEQLTSLLSTWESVRRQGRGQAVLVAGEAGIGKTRLLQELALCLLESGTATLLGRSHDAEGRPDFLPWAQIIESYFQSEAGRSLVPKLGSLEKPLARLCPDVFRGGSTVAPAAEEQAAGCYQFFDAISSFLRLACHESGPLLIVLDDLHEADSGSLALLAYLARDLASIPILLAACYRREGKRADRYLDSALASLAREGLAQQLNLEGLDENGAARLLEVLNGRPVSPEMVARVWDETQGNPFLLREQAGQLFGQGAFGGKKTSFAELPDGVKATMVVRLAALQPRTRRLLEIACVAGREFSLGVLERVSGECPAALLESLGEATSAQIIEQASEAHRFRFRHNLLRQHLYAGLELLERIRLHGEIGDAMRGMAGACSDDHLEELAHHYLEASPLGWREQALDFRLQAAQAAMHRSAWGNARRHLEQALALLSLMSASVLQRDFEVEIREGLGDTVFAADASGEASGACREAPARTYDQGNPGQSRLRRKIGQVTGLVQPAMP